MFPLFILQHSYLFKFAFNIYSLIKTVLNFLKTKFSSDKVIKLWISIVVYHWLVSFIAHRMWRHSVKEIQCLLGAQLGKSGAAVGKVQLGRAENGNRTSGSCAVDSWGTDPRSPSIPYLSKIQTCSCVTSGSPVVLCPSSLTPGTFLRGASPATAPSGHCAPSGSWAMCQPLHWQSSFKMWMTAQECWMYSWSRNRI